MIKRRNKQRQIIKRTKQILELKNSMKTARESINSRTGRRQNPWFEDRTLKQLYQRRTKKEE